MSSGSESDEEYVPGEPEQVSEEECVDDETELEYKNEQEHKTKKRKPGQISKGRKKIKTRNGAQNVDSDEDNEESPEVKVNINPEEEKKREDDLWAKFLEGTDTKPKPSVKETNNTSVTKVKDTHNDSLNSKSNTQQKDDEKERTRRIFDFAGEQIVVENNVVVDKIAPDDGSPSASTLQGPSSKKGAGLSNILDQLNKNNKLSTLEKSKLDWNTFKKEEGIEDEIVSHNKGKSGYLDRKDFLERTEHRQYEIERDVRMKRRSNR